MKVCLERLYIRIKHKYAGCVNGKNIYTYSTSYQQALRNIFRRAMSEFGKASITDLSVKIDDKWSKINFSMEDVWRMTSQKMK